MKYFVLLGGFAGFCLTFISGLLVGNPIDGVLLDASIGCLVGGVLMRGFRYLYIHSLRSVVAERVRRQAETAPAEGTTEAAQAV